MTLAEFKAWFEGFSEIMDGPPDEKQWARIKARVSEIDSKPISYPVFIDRYVAPYRRWYDGPAWMSGSAGGPSLDLVATSTSEPTQPFNKFDELKRAGRAEYSACLAN